MAVDKLLAGKESNLFCVAFTWSKVKSIKALPPSTLSK